jgi:putative hydrolase of the HAD superfamily
LARLPGRKLIYTNASRRHAEAVMARLGVAGHFEAIHDIADAGFLPKPDPRSYAGLVARHAIDPARACLIEDMAGNLLPAAALGMTTAWVRTGVPWAQPDAGQAVHIDHEIDDLAAWLAAVAGA